MGTRKTSDKEIQNIRKRLENNQDSRSEKIIVELEEFVFNIVSPVQKELEDLLNDVSALNEKVEILQWHDHGG